MRIQAPVEHKSDNVIAGNFSPRPPPDRGCEHCATRNFCLPGTASQSAPQDLQAWVDHWRPVPAGKSLFRQGDTFGGVFFVRSGSVKTFRTLASGDEQINGFHMPGDLFGIDGWQPGSYSTSAKTLETTSVCYLPVKRLQSTATASAGCDLREHLLVKVSELLNRQHDLSGILARNKAIERIAAFLLDLSERFASRHLSASEFRLPMSRTDISCYLGLSLECVSRAFTQLENNWLVACSGRNVTILDNRALQNLLGATQATDRSKPPRPA